MFTRMIGIWVPGEDQRGDQSRKELRAFFRRGVMITFLGTLKPIRVPSSNSRGATCQLRNYQRERLRAPEKGTKTPSLLKKGSQLSFTLISSPVLPRDPYSDHPIPPTALHPPNEPFYPPQSPPYINSK